MAVMWAVLTELSWGWALLGLLFTAPPTPAISLCPHFTDKETEASRGELLAHITQLESGRLCALTPHQAVSAPRSQGNPLPSPGCEALICHFS